jgi:hypothetical protein
MQGGKTDMRHITIKALAFVGIFGFILGLNPSSLLATPTPTIALRLINGANTVTVVDGDPADANPVAGGVTYSAGIGLWSLNVATGEGTPFLSLGSMDLNSVDTSAAGNPGTLTIMLSEDNINSVIPAFDMSIGGTVKNIKITYSAYYSSNNSFFSLTNLVGVLGPYQSFNTSAGFNGDLLGQPASGTVNSLTQVMTITPIGGETSTHLFSGDATLDPSNPVPTPEPSTLLLLGTALLGTGIIRTRWHQR